MADEAEFDPFFTPKNEAFQYHEVYSPLDSDAKQIRLISLLPGVGDTPVACELSTCSLSNPPSYEALSYCAGDPKDCGQIQLDGRPFNVFRSLYSALHHLRRPTQSRPMWVDQLCINQTDIPERNPQVVLMKDIYKVAITTLVWLGDPSPDTTAAFDLLQDFCITQKPKIYASIERYWNGKSNEHHAWRKSWDSETLSHQEVTEARTAWLFLDWWFHFSSGLSEHGEINATALDQVLQWLTAKTSSCTSHAMAWKGLSDLLRRPWWQRCWIVPEVTVSRRIVLHSGSRYIGWYDLSLFETCTRFLRLLQSYSSSTTTSLRTFIGKNQFRLELIRLYERSPAFRNTLYSLMANCYQCSASDRRDMVYALLGLTEDGSAGYSIKVDYSRSTQAVDVFIAAIKAIINVEGEYPFNLSRGSGTPSAVPSWIPDFEDLEEQVSVFGIRTRTDFKAGGPGIPSVDCLDRDKTMNIAGIEVARLDRNLAPTYNGSSTETDALRAWVGLVTRHFSQRGPLTEEVVRSFLAVIWDRELQWRELPARLIADQVNLVLALTDVVVARDLELRRAVGPARFFISHDDIMGLVPGNAEPGDLIFVPCAARAPIVVRETEMQGQFTVLGECYVHGIMEGQLFNEDGTPKAHEITTIDLV